MSASCFKNWIPVIAILCYGLNSVLALNYGTESLETCNSEECSHMANYLSTTIDSDTKPCDDFYKYACGKLLKETQIPEGWDAVNTVNSVVEEMKTRLIKSLQTKKSDDPEIVKKAKSLFASCTSEAEIENLGVVPLNILLRNFNMPLRPPFLGSLDMKKDFGALIGKMMQNLHINFPFRLLANIDPNNDKRLRLEILMPDKGINSRLPYRAPPPTSKPQTELKDEPKPTENEITNGPKAVASAKQPSRKLSKSRSMNLTARDLGGAEEPPKKKIVKKRPLPKGAEEEDKIKNKGKKLVRKKPVSKKADEKSPEKAVNDEEEKMETEKRDAKEAKNVEEKDENMEPSSDEPSQGAVKNNMPLEITESENQPLVEYMINVAHYLYKETNVRLLEKKKDSLREKVAEVAKIFHEIEKMTVKAYESEEDGKELTIQELQELTNSLDTKTDKKPLIDWSIFISTLLNNQPEIKKQFIEEGRKIYVGNINYLQSMLKFLYETNPRALYCALWWHVVSSIIVLLPADLRAFESEYRKQTKSINLSREESCLKSTMDAYGYAAAYDYIIDENTEANQKIVVNLFSLFYESLVTMIQESSILDARTEMAAIVRLDNGSYIIGTPDDVNSADGLYDTFRSVILHEHNFFFSRFFQTRESIKMELESLDSPPSFGIFDPLATTAGYNSQLNLQAIPLSHSQFPFMSNGLISLSMGGNIIPLFQQAIHHFDFLAKEYNLWKAKENWWSKRSVRNYNAQAECFINSYSKECFDKVGCVDGKRTLHENVADVTALEVVIQAYQNYQIINEEPRLVNFESFSQLQLLTLSFAVSMCQKETPEKLSEILKTGKHPPPSVRVNQALKNLPEFAQIWGCESGDKMNPSEKCQMWGFIQESKRKFKVESIKTEN